MPAPLALTDKERANDNTLPAIDTLLRATHGPLHDKLTALGEEGITPGVCLRCVRSPMGMEGALRAAHTMLHIRRPLGRRAAGTLIRCCWSQNGSSISGSDHPAPHSSSHGVGRCHRVGKQPGTHASARLPAHAARTLPADASQAKRTSILACAKHESKQQGPATATPHAHAHPRTHPFTHALSAGGCGRGNGTCPWLPSA